MMNHWRSSLRTWEHDFTQQGYLVLIINVDCDIIEWEYACSSNTIET